MGRWELWDILFPLLDKEYFHVIYKIRILSNYFWKSKT